jgi:hypothetical protein
MRAAVDRIGYLEQLHAQYNADEFNGKLMTITLLIKNSRTKDGWYEYTTEKREGSIQDAWYPRRDRLHNANIVITAGCWKEDSVESTMLHEMLHQYQTEVMDRPTSHDAIFCSMARRLERKYNMRIR